MLSNCYNEPFRNSRHNCLLHVLDMDESKSFRELENPSRVQWLNHLQASDEDQKEKWFRKRVKFTECQCLASLGEILRPLFPDQDRYGDSNCSSDQIMLNLCRFIEAGKCSAFSFAQTCCIRQYFPGEQNWFTFVLHGRIWRNHKRRQPRDMEVLPFRSLKEVLWAEVCMRETPLGKFYLWRPEISKIFLSFFVTLGDGGRLNVQPQRIAIDSFRVERDVLKCQSSRDYLKTLLLFPISN
ncbi:hypothetical protein CEXT_544511 [Caerostris extrusa]|uniref:Ycf2 n=1 Tax=Caerostris extrusa TaxID=172846 RepID=A0AAV4MYB8_CAEEX|nr:hypothetical protein CEXT_544511 [Caerostris extrusa]